jgi:cobalt-zinc-cadmium resistance protein CzcA
MSSKWRSAAAPPARCSKASAASTSPYGTSRSPNRITAIGNVLVPTAKAAGAALAACEIKVVNGASIIARPREPAQITVRTNIRGRDQGSFVTDAQQRFDREMKVAAGYECDMGRPVSKISSAPKNASL